MTNQSNTTESLDKIRDIIFGPQIADFEARLDVLSAEQLQDKGEVEALSGEFQSFKGQVSDQLKKLEETMEALQRELSSSFVSKKLLSQNLSTLAGQFIENEPDSVPRSIP